MTPLHSQSTCRTEVPTVSVNCYDDGRLRSNLLQIRVLVWLLVPSDHLRPQIFRIALDFDASRDLVALLNLYLIVVYKAIPISGCATTFIRTELFL